MTGKAATTSPAARESADVDDTSGAADPGGPEHPPAPVAAVGPARPAVEGDRDGLAAVDFDVTPWPGTVVDVGGRAIHVRRTPGPAGAIPTVYVHGLGGSATNFTDLAAVMSPVSEGHALDLPGFGRSEPPADGQYSLGRSAAMVVDYLRATGPAHLVGNSMGGAVSILVAARHPELVRTLTLVSPAMPDRRPDPRRVSEPRMFLALLPFVGGRVREELRNLTPEDRAMQMIRLCFGDPGAVPAQRRRQALEEFTERAEQRWAVAALRASFGALVQAWFTLPGRTSLWSRAAEITVPTTIVWGTKDRLVSVGLAAKLADTVPRSRVLLLAGVGHVAMMERPLVVARQVRQMQQAVDAGTW